MWMFDKLRWNIDASSIDISNGVLLFDNWPSQSTDIVPRIGKKLSSQLGRNFVKIDGNIANQWEEEIAKLYDRTRQNIEDAFSWNQSPIIYHSSILTSSPIFDVFKELDLDNPHRILLNTNKYSTSQPLKELSDITIDVRQVQCRGVRDILNTIKIERRALKDTLNYLRDVSS